VALRFNPEDAVVEEAVGREEALQDLRALVGLERRMTASESRFVTIRQARWLKDLRRTYAPP